MTQTAPTALTRAVGLAPNLVSQVETSIEKARSYISYFPIESSYHLKTEAYTCRVDQHISSGVNSKHQGRCLWYVMDWKGYGSDKWSWVSVEDILDSSDWSETFTVNIQTSLLLSSGRLWQRNVSASGAACQGGGVGITLRMTQNIACLTTLFIGLWIFALFIYGY